MNDTKRIDIKEFRKFGFLQEANRQFFHPLGLALEVVIDDETGEESLGGVWDYRDDAEGMFYTDELLNMPDTKGKAERVRTLRVSKQNVRIAQRGNVIQPIPDTEA